MTEEFEFSPEVIAAKAVSKWIDKAYDEGCLEGLINGLGGVSLDVRAYLNRIAVSELGDMVLLELKRQARWLGKTEAEKEINYIACCSFERRKGDVLEGMTHRQEWFEEMVQRLIKEQKEIQKNDQP